MYHIHQFFLCSEWSHVFPIQLQPKKVKDEEEEEDEEGAENEEETEEEEDIEAILAEEFEVSAKITILFWCNSIKLVNRQIKKKEHNLFYKMWY